MKNLSNLLLILMLSFVVYSLENCAANQQNKSAEKVSKTSPYLRKVSPDLAMKMKEDFEKCSYTILDQIIKSHRKDYQITNEQFKKIYDNFPEKSGTLKIHFVQYRKDQKYTNDYQELIPFDKHLYIIYSYAEENGDEKYHGIFSLEKEIDIEKKDFEQMKKDYNQYIKKEISKQNCISEDKQTDYVNIKKDEIEKYLKDVQNYEISNGIKGNIIKFILSTVTDIKKYNHYYEMKGDKAAIGQLTLITDTWQNENSSSRIAMLSDYDLNTLCPSNCDAK